MPGPHLFGGNHLGRCFVKGDMRKVLGIISVVAVSVSSLALSGTATGNHGRESRRKLVSDEKYSCSRHYKARVFRRPRGAEDGKHPANQKLKRLLENDNPYVFGPRHGWIRVYRQEGEAEFLREKRSGRAYFYVVLEKEGERWRWAGSGDRCRPLAWGPKTSGGTIELREEHPPQPDDTRLRVLVHEWACHGFRVPERDDVHPRISTARRT